MANKKKTVTIKGDFIKERLNEIGSSQVELATYLGLTPRHLNRCIQSNEMAEEIAVKTCNFLDVNIANVVENPTLYGISNAVLDGMTFAEQYQLSLKETDSQKRLFYLLMRFCGRSEREIFTYSDEMVALYMRRIQTFIEDEIIEEHLQFIKATYPQTIDSILQTTDDAIFDKAFEREQAEKERVKEESEQRKKRVANIDKGKVRALLNAGRSLSDIADEFGLEPQDIQAVIKTMKGGVSGK